MPHYYTRQWTALHTVALTAINVADKQGIH